MKKFKSFTIISSSFKCDKDCPYCTAKITKWPRGSDHWELLGDRVQDLIKAGAMFEYATLSGNGEPSMIPMADLQNIFSALRSYPKVFPAIRAQTSGAVFFNQAKFDLMRGSIFEVTRVSRDFAVDSRVLKYMRDYTQNDNFRKSPIILNIVLLKDQDIIEEIEWYLQNWPNIQAINLIILNANTLDGSLDNPYSQWIIKESVRENEARVVADRVSTAYALTKSHDDFFDSMMWETGEKTPILMYMRKAKYGLRNAVFYRGELVDYQLQPLII